jgi:GH18 family chitinase
MIVRNGIQAPDIPGIPPAGPSDGNNYLAFLITLREMLPGMSISITAPASYWYLKAFPIAQISKVVDYIILRTDDLHGQVRAGYASQVAQQKHNER